MSKFNEMSIEQLQQQYNLITQAIMTYQNRERTLWEKILSVQDPDYLKNEDKVKRQKELVQLQNEREEIMKYMVKQYEMNTKQHDSALKYKNYNDLVSNMQDNIYKQNMTRLGNVNVDILTNERLSTILKEEYNKVVFRTQVVNIVLIYLCLIIVLLVIGLNVKSVAFFCLIGAGMLVALCFVILVMKFWNSRNDYRMLNEEKDFSTNPGSTIQTTSEIVCNRS
jgi:hypothetical protein